MEIDIEIPSVLITLNKHDKLNYDVLSNKIILGLVGYAKSGKDFIAKTFIEDYGYQRVGFADNVKRDMNQYLKKDILQDYFNRSGVYIDPATVDFFTEDKVLKNILRPYIIWYAESMRKINGEFCWINKAFAIDGRGFDKIILSDVRRTPELDIFRNSNEFNKRTLRTATEAGTYQDSLPIKNFSTLLFEVNQFGLKDSDKLTVDTIQEAHRQWIIDDTFYVDSRLPESGNLRKNSINIQIKKITKKFGIKKPGKTKYKQLDIYQNESGKV